MNHQVTTDPTSHQNAPQQQVKTPAALETLLQVLSNVHSEIVLQEAATAKEATIDALISRFEDITSILKEAKTQRKVKRKDYVNGLLMEQPSLDGDSKTLGNRARIPTEVLRQLTQSGFLSTADLANTLLLTCKCYEIDLGREYVYEHLCKSRWRNINKLPPSLIADRGYYWLFRNLSRPIYESPAEPSTIPPPTFSYDDMLFSVSIRDGSGKEIVSEVLCGDQLDTLKRDGSAGVFLKNPIVMGTYPSTPVDAYAEYAESYEEHETWFVTVHLFRLGRNNGRNKCCCVHESGSCFWMTGFDYPGENAADRRSLTASLRFVGLVNSTPSVPTLELDEGGKLLEGRIQELDRYCLERNTFQGIKFDVHLNCFFKQQAQHQDDPSARTVVLEFGEVRLTALRVDSGGHDKEFTHAYAHLHGVTLPHLLEHLKGWDPND
jgi:hypothetical protein